MAVKEWSGIQQFPAATQTKLHELLGTLKQENVNTLTILVMGKGGVGKSSTVNSLVGERAVTVSAFQSETPRPVIVSRSRAGFTLNIIDTPGIVEGGYVNDQTMEIIKSFLKSNLLNKTIDVLLYVDRLDQYRVDNLDRQVVRVITDCFGNEIWRRGMVVLTHAQLSPPDGLSYDDFVSRRSGALLKAVRLGARIRKQDVLRSSIPIVFVENSGRCNKNEFDEKILPNGTPWIPNLVKMITDVVLNGSKGILVDKKLIEGPNPNDRGKILVPLIAACQPSQARTARIYLRPTRLANLPPTMLRHPPRFLTRATVMGWRRPFSTADLPAEPVVDSKFVEEWRKTIPNMEPPKTPSAFMVPRPPTPSSIPSKLTVNLVLPYSSLFSAKEVDMVIVPATTGQMGVLPGHVATISELKPGVLSIHEGNDVTKYFISSGFAFIHANSVADVIAVEAVPLDQIDPSLVQKGLSEFTQKLSSASTDVEKFEAQIGVDVHSSLNASLTG